MSIFTKGGSFINTVYGIIYCILNTVNDKKYIGQTIKDLSLRKRQHINLANNGSKWAIHQAIRKYSNENFEWLIIDSADNQEELNEKEMYWIDYYNTFYEGGYNMAVGGQCNLSEDPDEMSLMRGGQPFLVFNLDGEFVKEAISQQEFAKEIGVSHGIPNNVLKGRKLQVRGYVLIYKDEFSEELLDKKLNDAINGLRERPFFVFDKDTLGFIGQWNIKGQCSDDLKCSRETITRSLNTNNKNSRIQYLFFYENNLPLELEYKIKDVI